MKALVKTKSNYRNLNDTWVPIKKFMGSFVECEIFCIELNKKITYDLYLFEIKEIREDETETNFLKRVYNGVHNTNY